ncbi:hypothetical protein [Paludibaculum fermentans]|uniref:hypothetical protein n=1 Tax=Paludibaculum fermentans TaxID=1473598 RepID=UPI003EB7D2EF
MTRKIKTLICDPAVHRLGLALAAGLAASVALFASPDDVMNMHAGHNTKVPAKLVELVRLATWPFIDVNATAGAGYMPAFGCVTGPDHGAMGIHYINGELVGDGEVDASRPEALIYEPSRNGLRLVGVEFIVDAAAWMKNHTSPPMLEGQAFQFVNSPNRYGIPAFFELHVWAWRDNPNGAFVDWNNNVSCEGQ